MKINFEISKMVKTRFFKCVKEPVYEETPYQVNLFVSYTFYSGTSRSGDIPTNFYNRSGRVNFTLNNYYHTSDYSDEIVIDDYYVTHNLKDVMEYLEEVELDIDEDVKRFIEVKEKKGDKIIIRPVYDKDETIFYTIFVTTKAKDGGEISRQTVSNNIFCGLKYVYDKIRTYNSNYGNYYIVVHRNLPPTMRYSRKVSNCLHYSQRKDKW